MRISSGGLPPQPPGPRCPAPQAQPGLTLIEFDFDRLSRSPDVEAPNLQAYDATDRLLLDSAARRLAAQPAGVVLLGDRYGALTLGAALLHAVPRPRVYQDPLSHELALARNAAAVDASDRYERHGLGPELLRDARTVLLQLPRSLDALEEAAWNIATHADPSVTVYAGGRLKHMSLAMTAVLQKYFGSVTAGLARQKSRVLTASGPLPVGESAFPVTQRHDVGLPHPLVLRAFGETFGGAALDPGTRFLLPHLASAAAADSAIDLGCGNGAIAAYLALTGPGLRVIASDQSASAVASTRETARANAVGDRVDVVRDDALSSQPAGSAGLIVLNPPFHIGATVHAGIAVKLFTDAARVLAPGGELWTVWNSHLAYRPALSRIVGPTRQIDRNQRFTITCSVRR
ncbi:methyltransferase [Arthrobacter sp. MSA 4-2]|nr:methyltransferase [Arthrobacter sp. MSA 4-2]